MAERAEPALPARTRLAPAAVLRRLAAMPLRDPFAFAGITIYVLFALVALFADQLAPLDPMEILFTKAGKLAANVAPGAEFPLGTTNLGRDIYAQLIHGSRSALAVGLSAAVIVATVGTVVGLLSGYFGGCGRFAADAHRRHGAQPAVPALRHRADRLPRRRHVATSCSPWRCCCGPTPRA